MQFLLDDDSSEDAFLSSVPVNSRALAYYTIGEKAAAGGNIERAVGAFGKCVSSSDGEPWYREAGRVRLKQLSGRGDKTAAGREE